MLVTFSCEKYENITMFGDVAKKLLTMMGHSATVPGAIIADEVPAALAHLKNGLEQNKPDDISTKGNQDDDGEPTISLAHRAFPLIAMLEAASKHKCNVMWK